MRAAFLLTIASCVLVSSCDRKAEVAGDPHAELSAIADGYLEAIAGTAPFAIIFSGLAAEVTIDNAAFDLNSPEARAAFEAREDALFTALQALNREDYSDGPDWALYETLKEGFEANRDLRICRQDVWGLNHMFGWQNSLPQIAAMQPVATEEERAAALARWKKLPAFIAQDRDNLARGLELGYSAPKRVAARVIAQLDALLSLAPESSPFIAFAANVDDAAFKADAVALAADEIMPAIASYKTFLENDYLPAARDTLAVTALPEGEACYEAMLRGYHTAAIGAQETYRRGEERVAANTQGVIARGEAMFGVSDFDEILRRVNEAPENRFSSEAELIAATRALIPATREKVAPFFTALPAQNLVVEPYPPYLKGTGQSSRYETKPASEGDAIYRINTDDWETETRGGAEIVAVHEGWPGHHLQIATSQALGDLHPILGLLGSTAFIEGWARYAEALSEEAGIYETGFGEITRRAWPARGMVMDPGLHVMGWSEDEVKAFAKASGRFQTEEALNALLDRLAVIPGQLTAYDTGGLEIMALRAEAEARLGERFDIRAFHDRVLENGAAPLGALRAHVKSWIEDVEGGAAN